MTAEDFSKPCEHCAGGDHGKCTSFLCGCIVVHEEDGPVMRGFKLAAQEAHPERATWTKGGFSP